MEYTNNPNRVDSKVKEIQSMLNRALDNAVLLLKADSSLPSLLGDPHYFQTLHHRNYIPNGWEKISEDGRFGNETEKAVRKFQEFLYITVNGIVGRTTYDYLTLLSSASNCNIKMLGNTIYPQKQQQSLGKISLSTDLTIWKTNVSLSNAFISIFDLSTIVAVSDTTIHISWNNLWNNIVGNMLNSEIVRIGNLIYTYTPQYKTKEIIWINQGGRVSRKGNFTAYKIGVLKKYSKGIDNIKSDLHISGIGKSLGFINLIFEWACFGQKAFKGNLKIVEIASLAGQTSLQSATILAEPIHDWLIGESSISRKVPVKKAIENLGRTIVKTKYAKIVTNIGSKVGVTATGVGSASAIAVVGFQCVGAFLMGCEIGKFLEAKTHMGEKSINWLWGTFLGDWIKDFINWKVNRVVCIQYPANWTDKDIEEFHNQIENKRL